VDKQTSIITVTLNPAIDCVYDVPDFHIGGHQKGKCLYQTPAGKGVNVSRGLSKFHIPSLVTGFVGHMDHSLFSSNIQSLGCVEALVSVPGMTRRNVTLLDSNHNSETHIRDRGFSVEPQNFEELSSILRAHSNPGTVIVISGSLPPGITEIHLDRLVAECLEQKLRVAVDTSGPALCKIAERPIWLIKPNKEELEELTIQAITNENEFLAAGRSVCQSTGGMVLASWGVRGGYLFSGNQIWKGFVESGEDKAISTVGCGDAMIAGFLAHILNNHTPQDALKLSLATAFASSRSQLPSDFSETMLDLILNKTVVEQIE
jgi:1-phosphofructokinase family hexose kinase